MVFSEDRSRFDELVYRRDPYRDGGGGGSGGDRLRVSVPADWLLVRRALPVCVACSVRCCTGSRARARSLDNRQSLCCLLCFLCALACRALLLLLLLPSGGVPRVARNLIACRPHRVRGMCNLAAVRAEPPTIFAVFAQLARACRVTTKSGTGPVMRPNRSGKSRTARDAAN